jgi:hypothetical protein
VGRAYAAIYGPVMSCTSSGQPRGRGGKGTQPHAALATPHADTPAAAPPPRPARDRGKQHT